MVYSTSTKGKIVLQCDDCGKIRTVQRTTAILNKQEHPCRDCSNRRNGVAKRGRPSHNSGKRKPSDARMFGAKYTNVHGYVEIYVGEEEAALYGRKDSFVLEHRKVLQDSMGRSLTQDEIIHHVDNDKTNNSIDNLYLCRDKSVHRDIHNQLEEVSFLLFKAGVLGFDRDEGTYYIATDTIPKELVGERATAKRPGRQRIP